MCLYVDGIEETCTTNERTTTPGEVIILSPVNPKIAQVIELRFAYGQSAAIAELIYSSKWRFLFHIILFSTTRWKIYSFGSHSS